MTTLIEIEDAMALTEYVQDAILRSTPAGEMFANERESVGICELRTQLVDVLSNINAAYDSVACNASANEDSFKTFDDTYDLDFIPDLLDGMVDFGINPLAAPTTAFIQTAQIIWSK